MNTPGQQALWEALGFGKPPRYAHMSVTVSDSGGKLSKRERPNTLRDAINAAEGVDTAKLAEVGSISEEMFDHQMGINFKGAVFTLEKFLPVLNDNASVLNLSSVNAYTGMPNTAVYAASKAALNSFTRTAATELAPRQIRVNAINPGPVNTPIFGKTGLSGEQLESFAEHMRNQVPLKRFGTPEDIASLVVFLASDDASFITGGEYNIDGGIAM